jgi:hypothetical protein
MQSQAPTDKEKSVKSVNKSQERRNRAQRTSKVQQLQSSILSTQSRDRRSSTTRNSKEIIPQGKPEWNNCVVLPSPKRIKPLTYNI